MKNSTLEIERKFLVKKEFLNSLIDWRSGNAITQGYMSNNELFALRVRLTDNGNELSATQTMKEAKAGLSRKEIEFDIPVDAAKDMLSMIPEHRKIIKTRHFLNIDGYCFELDVFHGLNEGLIVAEIELDSEDQFFPKPEWLGDEITKDKRYYNADLVSNPYSKWLRQ